MTLFYDALSGTTVTMGEVLRGKHRAKKVDHVFAVTGFALPPNVPKRTPPPLPPPAPAPATPAVWPGDPAVWKDMSVKPTTSRLYDVWFDPNFRVLSVFQQRYFDAIHQIWSIDTAPHGTQNSSLLNNPGSLLYASTRWK